MYLDAKRYVAVVLDTDDTEILTGTKWGRHKLYVR